MTEHYTALFMWQVLHTPRVSASGPWREGALFCLGVLALRIPDGENLTPRPCIHTCTRSCRCGSSLYETMSRELLLLNCLASLLNCINYCPGLPVEMRQVRRVWCNARLEQAPFYNKHFGMVLIPGSAFEKGGRDYVLMELVTPPSSAISDIGR